MALFPHFEYKPGMRALNTHLELQGKYFERLLMRKGPLLQPEDFFLVIPPAGHIEKLRKSLGPFSVHMFNPSFINDQHALALEDAVELMVSERRITAPFVIKPNSSSTGIGIIFVEKNDEDYILTMRMPREGFEAIGASLSFYYLRDNEFQRLSHETDNEFKVLIPAKKMGGTLRELLLAAHVTRVPFTFGNRYQHTGDYSCIFVESYLPSWKFNGLAYETRHHVGGDLAGRNVTEITDYYARIGGSSMFANQMEARDKSKGKTLNRKEMYDPLLQSFNLNKEEFTQNLKKLLTAAFVYYSEQLSDEGFRFEGTSELEIDLMWQQPLRKGDFPRPVMTECGWVYRHPELRSTEKTPALKYVCSK